MTHFSRKLGIQQVAISSRYLKNSALTLYKGVSINEIKNNSAKMPCSMCGKHH